MVIGVAIITLAADLVNLVYQLLNGILQGEMGIDVFRRLEWSLQTLIVAAPVLWYHWRVLREHQGPSEEKQAAPKTITLLAGEPDAAVIARIEDRTGSRITRLRFLGQNAGRIPALTDEQLERLIRDIQAAPGDKVMLIATEGRIMILPYQEQ